MSQVATSPDTPAPASSAGSRVNRSALAAASAVGQTIGALPACFIIGGPGTALSAPVFIFALTLLTLVLGKAKTKTKTMSTAQPKPRHFVMAAASAAFHGGVTGFLLFGLWTVLAAAVWLLRAIFGPFEVSTGFATATLLCLAIPLFLGSAALTLRELTEQLYPDRAGVQPVFETAQLSRRLMWWFTGIVLAAGVVLFGAAVLSYQISGVWAFVLLLIVLAGSSPLATLSSTEKQPVVSQAIDATRKVLEKAGYEVLQAPRTGDAAVDPLLADLSLYVRASGQGSAFAIDIKASSTNQPLDWSAASSLKLKVSALTNIESRDEARNASPDGSPRQKIDSITPVLVALTPADDTLREFAADHNVKLFELAPTATVVAARPGGQAPATDPASSGAPFDSAALLAAATRIPSELLVFIAQRAPGAVR